MRSRDNGPFVSPDMVELEAAVERLLEAQANLIQAQVHMAVTGLDFESDIWGDMAKANQMFTGMQRFLITIIQAMAKERECIGA